MEPTPRCERAIAFLKARGPDEGPSPTMKLAHDDSPVLRDLGNDLLVSYVLDDGDRFVFVNNRQIAAEGLTGDELHRIGLGNLADAANASGVQVHPYGSIFAVIAGGNFEASLILLDDLWERAFRPFVAGTYAIAIPCRDILGFGDADDPNVRAELRAMIDRLPPDADHRLLDGLFVRVPGGWTRFAE